MPPWCGWSKKAKPAFAQLHHNNPTNVTVAAVNSDEHKNLTEKHNVEGYPTIKYYPQGMNNQGSVYSGARDYDSMLRFLQDK